MRYVALAFLGLAFLSGCGSPESRAKEVAASLFKAIKDKNIDEVMSRVTAPFVIVERTGRGYRVDRMDLEALRAVLVRKFETDKTDGPQPNGVLEVVPAANVAEKYAELGAEPLAAVKDALGTDGFVVVMESDGKPLRLLVAMKGRSAKVTGSLP